ncbi:cell division protein ZapA [Roseivivax isoporae]|uniref:Cell division protein ZapA n=1 Tax=Roseivivax isoporae LMG 25204 TaxID=1449351 RepID=X7F9G3_9RHOB|nr:cell division protein ZapA [Roseivivax isoporae]ETX29440.1 cell division protein ZapA [Roseivivax isoporae LMG 25204]
MPEIDVRIGGRTFTVACHEGEEEYLRTAAGMLDAEAQVLVDQLGRVPEARMLLMAGLMLADKTAGLEERLREAETREAELGARIAAAEAETESLRQRPEPEPRRVEVPVIPAGVTETLAELAARAEAIAADVEDKAAG